MDKIKLQEIPALPNGTCRFQSQLYVGRDTADFIMRADEIMRCYKCGDNGFDFYPYDGQYEILMLKK